MKHPIIAGAAVAAMVLAGAGCGGTNATPGPARYLADSPSKVAFIQWRAASGGHLQGMVTEASVGGSGSAQTLSVTSARFTGRMTGDSVRLIFAVPYFLRAHAHGTLSGGTLTMVVPRPDGTVKQAKFSQSSEADYDRAIAALRTKIRRATVVAARQQGAGGRQSAHAQAEQGTQKTLTALYEESSIAHGGKFTDGLARLAGNLQTARSRLATERADASGANKYCTAAFRVTGDAQAVDGTVQNAQGAVLALMPDVMAVRHDMMTATTDLRHLRKAGLPAPVLASNVIANANSALKQAIVTANSYIQQVNAINARARSLADGMATRKCSSARSGSTPHLIPPIHLGTASGATAAAPVKMARRQRGVGASWLARPPPAGAPPRRSRGSRACRIPPRSRTTRLRRGQECPAPVSAGWPPANRLAPRGPRARRR